MMDVSNNSTPEQLDVLDLETEIKSMFKKERDESQEPEHGEYDLYGISTYLRACETLSTTPAQKVIKQLPTSEILIRHRNIGPQGAKALASALKDNLCVEKLDVQDNGLGEEGSCFIAKMLLDNNYISELNIAENCMKSKGADMFCEVMKSNTSIKILNLAGNSFTDKGAKSIANGIENNTCMEDLDLSYNEFSDYGAVQLGQAISQNCSIKKLNISWNCIRKKGAVGICKGIKENTRIISVNLSWNGLAYEGALSFRELLKTNQILQEVDVSNNGINWDGALLIAQGLKHNDTLKILKIGQNPLSMTGCMDILDAINNHSSAVEDLSFEGIPICKRILYLKNKISQRRPFTLTHGPVLESEDVLGRRKVLRGDPLKLLVEFLSEKNMRVLELFRTFDQANIHVVSREKFIQGLKKSGAPLENYEISELVEKLDSAKAGKISYKCFMDAVRNTLKEMREEEKKLQKKKTSRVTAHKKIMSSDNVLPDINQSGTSVKGITRRSSIATTLLSRKSSRVFEPLLPSVSFLTQNEIRKLSIKN